MTWMAISVIFLVPSYYRANSKGYNGKFWAVAAGVACALIHASALYLAEYWIPPFFALIPPAFLLLVMFCLPEKAGAPGKEYLTITFTCPECGCPVSYPRHREGVAVLCKHCEEVISVPTDKPTPADPPKIHSKPDQAEGSFCIVSYGKEMAAYELVAILGLREIEAFVTSDDAGGALPHVGNTQGYRVMIDIQDWDAAERILQDEIV